jgi:hypothetical protein
VTLIAKLAKLLGHRWWSQSEISYDEVHLTLPFDTVSDLARQCIFKLEYRDDVSSELNLWADNCFEAWQDRVFLRESPFVFKKSGKSESQVSLGRVVVDQAS